jgi:hypothetical protein
MNVDLFYAWPMLALSFPFLSVALILAHYFLRRFLWRRSKRHGSTRLGFCPSSFALGMAFQFIQVFHRPSMVYVLEAKRDEEADEDDNGDPETLTRQLSRQLRRIRRGDHVDRLVLRL